MEWQVASYATNILCIHIVYRISSSTLYKRLRSSSSWLQMSLCSLCLLFMRSLVLQILLCIPRCFHLLHDGTMNFSLGLDTAPWHHYSWTGLPFLLGGWKVLHQWCHCTRHIILKCRHLLFGTSLHSSLLVGDLCMRSFLQVKCICMVRSIS